MLVLVKPNILYELYGLRRLSLLPVLYELLLYYTTSSLHKHNQETGCAGAKPPLATHPLKQRANILHEETGPGLPSAAVTALQPFKSSTHPTQCLAIHCALKEVLTHVGLFHTCFG